MLANSSQWQVGGLSAETRQTPLWTKQILDVNRWGKPPRSICPTPGMFSYVVAPMTLKKGQPEPALPGKCLALGRMHPPSLNPQRGHSL